MAIVARDAKKHYTPAPSGLWSAVCCDVIDLGMVESQFGERHQVELRWQISEEHPETGKPFLVVRRFTLSLNEKSNLRPFLESWRGAAYTEDEVEAGVDIEAEFLGQPALLQVMHKPSSDGRIFANPASALPLPDAFTKVAPRDYVRVKDRGDESF